MLHPQPDSIIMSSSVAHAACDHIVQSLHGHIAFLKDQGALSDESLKMYVLHGSKYNP